VTESDIRIEEINVILGVEHLGNRKVATIRLGRSDASIYVFPYSSRRTYYYGSSSMEEKQSTSTFNYSEQETSFEKPHLSIHESGAVQVTLNRGTRVGPVQITPLTQAPRGHLATVRVDRIAGLRAHDGPMRSEGKRTDWLVTVPADVPSCRLVLRLRHDGEQAPNGSAFVFLQSPRLVRPVALCLEVWEDSPIGEAGREGVTVVAGWDPVPALPPTLEVVDFVYLRAE
jgi:hypothetical protein